MVLLLSLASYSANQYSAASPAGSNLMGPAGALIGHACIGCWGVAAFFLPLVLFGYSVALWREYDLASLWRRLTGALLLLPALCGLVHLLPPSRLSDSWLIAWDQCQLKGLGGALGHLLCGAPIHDVDNPWAGGLLLRYLDLPGTIVALLALAVLALLLMDIGLARWVRRLYLAGVASAKRPRRVSEGEQRYLSEPYIASTPARTAKDRSTSVHELTKRIASEQSIPPDAADLVEKIRSHRRALERGEAPACGGLRRRG